MTLAVTYLQGKGATGATDYTGCTKTILFFESRGKTDELC